jgi:hypothetical protein
MVRLWKLPNTMSHHARGRRQREVSASGTGKDVVMNEQRGKVRSGSEQIGCSARKGDVVSPASEY